MIHYQLTYEEARQQAASKWIDPGDYRRQPWMLCRTGDGHAKGLRVRSLVTCPACKSVRENTVTRFVVTKLDTSGTAPRTLFDAAQGQHTYATAEEAQARADAFKSDRHCKDMALEVRPCECWPVHFDPKGVWFDA